MTKALCFINKDERVSYRNRSAFMEIWNHIHVYEYVHKYSNTLMPVWPKNAYTFMLIYLFNRGIFQKIFQGQMLFRTISSIIPRLFSKVQQVKMTIFKVLTLVSSNCNFSHKFVCQIVMKIVAQNPVLGFSCFRI